MAPVDKPTFLRIWPNAFVIFMAVIEIISVIVLFLTELGSIAANFWTTNVFAGAWCGIVLLIHAIALFVSGCCVPGPSSAFRGVIITFITLVALVLLIVFDGYFVSQPTACLLTSSCSSNAASNTSSTWNFRQSFFTTFNNMGAFKYYTEAHSKLLFQSIQIGVGSLCFFLCLIYLVLYYISVRETRDQTATNSPDQPKSNYFDAAMNIPAAHPFPLNYPPGPPLPVGPPIGPPPQLQPPYNPYAPNVYPGLPIPPQPQPPYNAPPVTVYGSVPVEQPIFNPAPVNQYGIMPQQPTILRPSVSNQQVPQNYGIPQNGNRGY